MAIPFFKQYNSKAWFDFRAIVLDASGGKCAECAQPFSKSRIFQVHHLVYDNKKMLWDYTLESVMAVCKGCHAKLHGIVRPTSGWSLEYEDDLGKPCGICDYCNREVRFAFQISHPQWLDIVVGSGCCDKLTETSIGMERQNFLKRQLAFVNAKWIKETPQVILKVHKKYEVRVISVNEKYQLKINSQNGKLFYNTNIEAKAGAFRRIEHEVQLQS